MTVNGSERVPENPEESTAAAYDEWQKFPKQRYGALHGAGGSYRGRAAVDPSHRTYGWTYAPTPDVFTPMGNRNTGYVTSTVPGYDPFRRGDLPDAMPQPSGFGLPRPRFMREPGNTWGSYPAIAEG